MGATNRSKLSYVLENTPGTTPSNPVFKELRVTSSGLRFNPERKMSNEIRSDRQVTDQILTGLAAEGPFGVELSFGAYDDLIEAALQGTWSKKVERDNNGTADSVITDVATTNTVVTVTTGTGFAVGHLCLFSGFGVSGNNGLFRCSQASATVPRFASSGITDEAAPPAAARIKAVGFQGASGDITATASGLGSSSLDFTTLGIVAGEWLKIGGATSGLQFATAALNGWARVSAVAANAITFDIFPTGWTTDSGTGKTVQVFFGDVLRNGTTQRPFTFERQQQDLTSPAYELFKGIEIAGMNWTMQAGEIIAGNFSTIGRSATVSTSRSSGATDVAAPTYPVLNAASNVGSLLENGALVTTSYMTELGFELNNNLAGQRAIGDLANVGIRNGEVALGGTLKAYFNDTALLSKVINDTETSIMFKAGQSSDNKNAYVFDIPRVKLTGTSEISGKNSDRMFDGRYDALRHATLGYTVSIGRFFYLPN